MQHDTQENTSVHTQYQSIEGKTVLISGGTTGIGRAIARLLGHYGAKIFIFGRHSKELIDAIIDIKETDTEVHGITADQSKIEDVEKVFSDFDEKWDQLDILINNAAIGAEDIESMAHDDWKYIIESNLNGYFACTKEALKRMESRKEGHIINIGSMSADEREEGSSVYVATKSAIQGFTEALRKEVNEKGIKVSLVEPGKVGTDMQKESPDEQRKLQKEEKMLKAEDIAVCVYYILTQPKRCDVVEVKIRPHLQVI
jgi:NADP-dependent 3-hydroxy acid dehydrogenase YdfG